ncbi:LVIVD repeat-containing protein [Nocardioides sp.]|uniref:LVIVD repeat-containing protein n=1 Tax=Nocardioides sp. TaxID=35761 RepID=UPI003513B867
MSRAGHPALRALLALGLAAVAPVLAAPAVSAHQAGDLPTNTRGVQVETEGEGMAMEFVANLQYNDSGEAQNGSDIEFMRLGKKEYALAGTRREGLQIIDITTPRKPKRVAVYDCAISQGDIQVWTRRGRVLASYTADGTGGAAGAASRCGRDLELSAGDAGTVIVDLTKPRKPQTVSFLPVGAGSHNMTIHPSGKYLYNSNSDLLTAGVSPFITIYDISAPTKPRFVQDFEIPFVPTSLGSESHDITFSADGSRAYSAALSQTLVMDTTDPADPEIIGQIIDPAVNVAHQADPITMKDSDGVERTILVVTDERAGAAASVECPGGGLHLYDITGDLETAPAKIGAWFAPVFTIQDGAVCTSHVLRIYPRQKLMTIAWYAQGVRVIDLSGLADAAADPLANPLSIAFGDGVGMTEVGYYTMADSDSWSFKTNKIKRNGSFYGYSNDLVRGFDVFKYDGSTIGKVKPLKPKNLKPKASARVEGSGRSASLALLVPAALGGLVLHRLGARRRRTA